MTRITTFIAAVCLAATTFAAPARATERWMSIPQPPAMPEAVQSGLAPVNGIKMYYATYGKPGGTPVLLIHGGLAHGDVWAAQVADLMKDHRVIVADTRGHGRTNNDGSDYSYDLLATDYLALLDYLKVDAVDLVGWSDGANIGYVIARDAPGRLKHLFAHAGNVTAGGIDPAVDTNELFGAYVGMMAAEYAKMSPTPEGFDDFVNAIVTMWGTETLLTGDDLKSITVPTLVVQGEHDEAILAKHSADIADTIPGAGLLVLKGVSHFALFQAPGEYTAAIRAFIDG